MQTVLNDMISGFNALMAATGREFRIDFKFDTGPGGLSAAADALDNAAAKIDKAIGEVMDDVLDLGKGAKTKTSKVDELG